MAQLTVQCAACGRSFSAPEGSGRVFCTCCGAPCLLEEEPGGGSGLGGRLLRMVEPEARVRALADYAAAHPGDAEARALGELFALRYTVTGKRRKTTQDNFLRLWFNLVIFGKQYERKSDVRLARRELEQFFGQPGLRAFLEKWPMGRELLEQELRNGVYVYFESSRGDRSYTTGLLNLLQLKREDVEAKAAADAVLGSAAILHAAGKLEEYSVLVRVAREAYLMAFPGGQAAYNRFYNAWKERAATE